MDFWQELRDVAKGSLTDHRLTIPGIVLYARTGEKVLHQAFGYQDLESNVPMKPDSLFRMYSMTKVITATVAMILCENGCLELDDAVSKYIPAFDRKWDVIEPSSVSESQHSVDYRNHVSGERETLHYNLRPSTSEMKVYHLMSETSGIGYEFFYDMDAIFKRQENAAFTRSFAIANALRWKQNSAVYRSSSILGADVTLEEFCNVLANAGVLVCEPGSFSYGLGATVLGRIIEVAYARHFHKVNALSDIFQHLLFEPLEMHDSFFFLKQSELGGERYNKLRKRVVPLYGAVLEKQEGYEDSARVVPAAESVPACQPVPYSNHIDHFEGARSYESGDTGCLMSVSDYALFLDFLGRGGTCSNGTRLLSSCSTASICGQRCFKQLNLSNPLARLMNVDGVSSSFNFGWACSHGTPVSGNCISERHQDLFNQFTDVSHCCRWAGYANTQVQFFPAQLAKKEGQEGGGSCCSYIIIGVQMMCTSLGGYLLTPKVCTKPILDKFKEICNLHPV